MVIISRITAVVALIRDHTGLVTLAKSGSRFVFGVVNVSVAATAGESFMSVDF
jgi:hypothetical protein